MAIDHGHSHPLYARVGNTEYTIAWLKLPVKTGRPINEGDPINEGEPAIVDMDEAAVEMLRRRLGLPEVVKHADGAANVQETGKRPGSGSEVEASDKSEADKGKLGPETKFEQHKL